MSKQNFIMWIIFMIVALWILCLPLICKADTPKWKFYIMGVDVSEFRDAKPGERAQLLLGGLVSCGVHVGGHYVAAEMAGVNITQVGFTEYYDRPNSWVDRGGFLFQLGINTLLVEFMPSYFTKGYTAFTAIELSTYPVRRVGYGDFHFLDNGDLEYYLYSTWAAHNLWRVNHADH